ncbi:MAG: squalene synthase HpnC [Bryobacterales bacterium]|nr:squalene synthase HpnC [Bryobacterales bacterium]
MEPAVRPLEFLRANGRAFPVWSLEASEAYSRHLTRLHYENFSVAGPLVPANLRQDCCNVYAFCRWADDLGDETGDAAESVDLLTWWREQLHSMETRQPHHPVFVALRDTIGRHRLPLQDFDDLINAFLLDQSKRTYADLPELLQYCELSANPVGRIVLRMHGYADAERLALSDNICSALQLANHWQDVRRDWDIGRVYIPERIMDRHGYSFAQLANDVNRRQASPQFRSTLKELAERAGLLFERGRPLAGTLRGRLALEVDLFRHAGLQVLAKIRRQGFDTITKRPVIGRLDRVRLLARVFATRLLPFRRGYQEARDAVA